MRPALSLVLPALLAACSAQSGYDPDRCSAAPGPPVAHLTDTAQACIARWGNHFSTSPDPARDVADAVLMACKDTIPDDSDDTDDDGDTTGAASKAQWAEARHLAVFRVVEERAGH